jgi:hypothetical protein
MIRNVLQDHSAVAHQFLATRGVATCLAFVVTFVNSTLIFIEPNTNMDNTFIAVPVADIEVEIYENGMSRTTIGTSGLGPCVAILIDLSYSGQKYCILDHCSFGLDESEMTSSEIVFTFLEHMMELIKDHVKVSPFEDNENKSKINHIDVLISAGDIREGVHIRDSFKLLLQNKIQIDQKDKDILFLYKNIKNHLIILNPVTKILPLAEEAKG